MGRESQTARGYIAASLSDTARLRDVLHIMAQHGGGLSASLATTARALTNHHEEGHASPAPAAAEHILVASANQHLQQSVTDGGAVAHVVSDLSKDLLPQLEANTQALRRMFACVEELEAHCSRADKIVSAAEQYFSIVARNYDAKHPAKTISSRVMRSLSFMSSQKSNAQPIPEAAPSITIPLFSSPSAAVDAP